MVVLLVERLPLPRGIKHNVARYRYRKSPYIHTRNENGSKRKIYTAISANSRHTERNTARQRKSVPVYAPYGAMEFYTDTKSERLLVSYTRFTAYVCNALFGKRNNDKNGVEMVRTQTHKHDGRNIQSFIDRVRTFRSSKV